MGTDAEDVPQEQWEKEWEGLKVMGGCGVISQAKSMGITCSTDLSTNEMISGAAPGIQGSLCDKCAASCKAEGQDCASGSATSPATSADAEDMPQEQWEKEWEGLKAMGGCGVISQAKSMGITCSTDLSTNEMISGAAPGIQGSLCDKCAASCKAEGQDCVHKQVENAMTMPRDEKVLVVFTMEHLVFGKLNANELLEAAVVSAVKGGILAVLSNYSTEDIDVSLSAGSVIATAHITPRPGTKVTALANTLNNAKETVLKGVQNEVLAVPQLSTVLASGKATSDVTFSATSPSTTSATLVKGNCKVPYAPGIHANERIMLPITDYVDGPDPDQADIEQGELMITIMTSVAIGLGCLFFLLGIFLTCLCSTRARSPSWPQAETHQTGGQCQPTILTTISQASKSKESEVSV